MLHYVERLREEIAGVARRRDDQTAFDSMSDQLDAIVAATGEATDTILGAVEAIGVTVDELREQPEAEKRDELCDRIAEKTIQAMEACSFQDITGQRVSKIIRSMKFIEERVDAMADLWGRKEIEELGSRLPVEEEASADGIVLHGPQSAGEAISQDDIDKLFS